VDLKIVLWFILVVAMAKIGLWAILARMLYLKDKKEFQCATVG
jgi:hypothetical protein